MADAARNRDSDDAVANARIGYQAAVSLWTYEGAAIWARFNAMLVANSIVIAVIGLALTSEPVKGKLADFTAGVGFLLCFVWGLFNIRGFDYHNYWIRSARELEEAYLTPVETVSRGARFGDGLPVTLTLGGNPTELRMGRFGRFVPVAWASCGAIVVFAIMYLAVLVGIV